MSTVQLPEEFNYIAAFLSFACQLRCPYCINHHGGDLVKARRMTGSDWIAALSRLPLSDTLPATLQGGEPTVHKDFYEIVAHRLLWGKMDLLTNGMFDIDEWIAKVDTQAFHRGAPYASIRISYHIGQNDKEVIGRTDRLAKAGYQVGIWAVNHPDHVEQIKLAQLEAWERGIDFRLKEFLGPHGGVEYGTFAYPDAVNSHSLRHCKCKTNEFLIAPDGVLYRCHSDLYAGRAAIGHVMDEEQVKWKLGQYSYCGVFGKCNSCDLKVKNNRFQEYGYSSVAISNISDPYAPNTDYVKQVINTYGKQ